MAQLAPVTNDPIVPPQNLEAEESVLGAAMLSPGAIAVCREILRDDGQEFYRESHAKIWRTVVALTDRREPVDAITLTDELGARGWLDDVGGRVRLHELAALVPASANAGHYARIVAETGQLRALIRLGAEIQRLGWERPGEPADLLEQATMLTEQTVTEVGTRTSPLEVETWAEFERSATEHVPTIVGNLWPEAGLGFIAAPPKRGKTWVGLSLAISVATGQPFLASFDVEKPEAVVLLALEGHRAAIRGRIGALAHGLGIDPHTDERLRENLHIIYKPVGINLADPAWIRTVRDTVRETGARFLIVDVLRAAAVMKENSNDEFGALVRALQPLQQDGCAIALLHHFGKLTELSKDRLPGERMAGAGAMQGAYDVGVFITRSDDGARTLRVEFEARDLATPDPIGLHLDGDPTGKNGGFVFSDAASWRVLAEVPADTTESAEEFRAWLEQQPDHQATTDEIIRAWNLSDKQIRLRRPDWIRAGVEWEPAKGGKPAVYFTTPNLDALEEPAQGGQADRGVQETLNLQAEAEPEQPARPQGASSKGAQTKTPDLQDESSTPCPPSLTERRAPSSAAAQSHREDPDPNPTTDPDADDWTTP